MKTYINIKISAIIDKQLYQNFMNIQTHIMSCNYLYILNIIMNCFIAL